MFCISVNNRSRLVHIVHRIKQGCKPIVQNLLILALFYELYVLGLQVKYILFIQYCKSKLKTTNPIVRRWFYNHTTITRISMQCAYRAMIFTQSHNNYRYEVDCCLGCQSCGSSMLSSCLLDIVSSICFCIFLTLVCFLLLQNCYSFYLFNTDLLKIVVKIILSLLLE